MSTFQSEYETSTNSINDVVNTQLSSVLSWLSVPGSLTKASASSSGFVWGYNSGNTVYTCQLPCSGNWKPVDFSAEQVSSVIDLTTDETNVYILYTNSAGVLSLLVTPSSNQGTRTTIKVPFAAKSIFSTHTYIWAQDGSNHKERCAKPCSMPNWQASTEKSVTITSADNTTLYGVDPLGQAMQTNENLQSAWLPIGDVLGSIYGKGNDGTLYGIDSAQNAFQYNGKVSPLYTDGLHPSSLSVDSQTSQLWMTTGTPGESGNIFTRSQKPDYSTIMNRITPLDQTRDKVVNKVETKYQHETNVMTLNKQVEDVITYFKKMFNIDKTTAGKAKGQSGKITESIREAQSDLDQIQNVEPFIIGVIGLLVVVILIYLVGTPLLGSYIHLLALVIFGVGMFLIVNFSDTIKQWVTTAT
jgi:hypothetical protein